MYINNFKKYINIYKKKYINIQNKYIDIQKVYQVHQYLKEVYLYSEEVFWSGLAHKTSSHGDKTSCTCNCMNRLNVLHGTEIIWIHAVSNHKERIIIMIINNVYTGTRNHQSGFYWGPVLKRSRSTLKVKKTYYHTTKINQ